jgi:RimJ/RimL family protein N-acetyltransferase
MKTASPLVSQKTYLFTSSRLGFRNWLETDLDPMAELNTDVAVMEFFPSVYSREQTLDFIKRMQLHFQDKGFCYFAVDRLDTQEFIGFIGLMSKDFEADFTPCTDIGWRLKKSAWNSGFATEGARCCLEQAFNRYGMEKVYSMAPKINVKSEQVMKKTGMKKVKHFDHPALLKDDRLRECVLYELTKEQ